VATGAFRHRVYGSLTRAAFGVVRRLPPPTARRLGLAMAGLAGRVVPRVRAIGSANLDLAYGDALTPVEKQAILRGAVENLGIVAAEFCRIPELATPVGRNLFDVTGLEHIDRDRGAIFVSAHFGNWEWLGPAGAAVGLKVALVVRPFDDPRLDRLIDGVRRSGNVETFGKDNALGSLLNWLRNRGAAGILADQSPRENGVPVTFFGQPCWATAGPALIARRARVPIHPVFMTRQPGGRYVLAFEPPIEPAETGDPLEDLRLTTQRIQDALEKHVRACPEQWLWMHRRWRIRDRLEREWAERKARRARRAPEEGDASG